MALKEAFLAKDRRVAFRAMVRRHWGSFRTAYKR
jgi:hypothetical protein